MRHSAAASADVERFRGFLRSGMPGSHAYVVLLGMKRFDFPGIIEEIDKGLPFSAFERLQKNTELSTETLLELLQIPRRTLTRRKSAGRLSSDESDRLVRLARVYGRTLHFFDGNARDATGWLEEAQLAFGGISPMEMIKTDVGAQEVERLIGQLEHGVFP